MTIIEFTSSVPFNVMFTFTVHISAVVIPLFGAVGLVLSGR